LPKNNKQKNSKRDSEYKEIILKKILLYILEEILKKLIILKIFLILKMLLLMDYILMNKDKLQVESIHKLIID